MDEVKITVFSLSELYRLAMLIPQTDPRTPQYATLLESIERYSACATDIDTILIKYAEMNGLQSKEVEFDNSAPAVEQAESNVIPFPANEIQSEENAVKAEEESVKAEPECDKAETKCDQVTYSKAEVRAVLTDHKKAHPEFSIPNFLKEKLGCASFPEVPEDKYSELMAYLAELKGM